MKAPRLAQYMQTAWKKHQNTEYWVDIQTCSEERIKVLSDAIERHHPLRHTPSLLYPESCFDGIWRNYTRKYICHLGLLPRFPSKDNWKKELDSEVAGGGEDSQQTQPKTKSPIIKNSETPWVSNRSPRRSKKMSCSVAKAQKFNKDGETCGCTKIHPELCASAC